MSDVTPITDAPKRKRRSPSKKDKLNLPPAVWQPPLSFPDHAASILKKTRISKKQFPKFAEKFTLFLLANMSSDFAIALQHLVRSGDPKGLEMFAKLTGFMKNESGVTINLNQNNLNVAASENRKEIDQLVRMLDARDRETALALPAAPVAQPDDILDGDPEDEEED